MQIQAILKRFGLSEKEISVYLALIELGPSPVRSISLKSKVNRGTTYDILKSLISLGVVAYYNKESKQYFVAEPPENLLSAISNKQKELTEIKEDVQANLPLLKTLFEKQGGKPVVKFYEGAKGISLILEDVLEEVGKAQNRSYYLYSSATQEHRKNVYGAMPNFSEKRVKKGIQVKIISLGEGGKLAGLDERKQMPVGTKDLKSTHEIIYAGKVAHISLDDKEDPVGVVIQNEAIFETQKILFEFNWSKL
jgi:sugar-specific transcriptional regulator TrmB